MNFTLYPTSLSDGVTSEPFDETRLPFQIVDGVQIEAVADRFPKESFELWEKMIGELATISLKRVRYALVHRYDRDTTNDGEFIPTATRVTNSWDMIRLLAACLRLIRPMRQQVFLIHGTVDDAHGHFKVEGFDSPRDNFIEVPEVQKLAALRNQDAEDLKTYAPMFLHAMRGKFLKFRHAVRFHEGGYYQDLDWDARYLLWCSAIESIYTSNAPEHRGRLVATSRIKWFLGEDTSIYTPGELTQFDTGQEITVGKIVDEMYKMRNFLAHGDIAPESFSATLRHCVVGGVSKAEVLYEVASFIIRASLLKILREGLLDRFKDAAAVQEYFSSQRLTRSELQKQGRRADGPSFPP